MQAVVSYLLKAPRDFRSLADFIIEKT